MGMMGIRDELNKMNEEYNDRLWELYCGPLLTSPQGIDSSRLNMFNQHLKQFLMILNPDYPRLSTGFENVFGKYSKGYYKLDGKWTVVKKIEKYGPNSIYMLILYNKDEDRYDMIEKKFAEGMQEKQGYLYNTAIMDDLEEGDIVKDAVLYKTTSFDDNMNYRYGKNAKVLSTITNDTLEDSIRIRRGFAMGVHSVEIDPPQASVNNNDIPLNIHGNDHEYKSIPNIGEKVDGTLLFATRRLNKSHIMNDFKESKMSEVLSTDNKYRCSKNAVLYDIDIYYNGEDPFPDNIFYKQLKWYYDKQCEYADNVNNAIKIIKESGSDYTEHVPFYSMRYKHWNDPEYSWSSKDKNFGNILIDFHCAAAVPLGYGSKITGRYGNKGVICSFAEDVPQDLVDAINKSFGLNMIEEERNIKFEIIDDDQMPYTDDGPVDILLDVSASVRRLIMDSTHEVEINFIAEQVWKKLKSLETFEEKKELFFDFLLNINQLEYDCFYKIYESFDRTINIDGYDVRFYSDNEKMKLIKCVEEQGFYLVKPPHMCIRYNEIKGLYKKYPWIKPIPLYINHFGRKIRLMRDGVVGNMYLMFLKQNTNKNFSARSTFRINRAGIPTKDNSKKVGKTSYSKTPVKLSEIYNLMAMLSGADIAEYNLYMRSAPLARKSMDKIMASVDNPLAIKRLDLKSDFVNMNAMLLNAKFKGIGMKLEFVTENELNEIGAITCDMPVSMRIDNYVVYDRPDTKPIYKRLFELYNSEFHKFSVIEMGNDKKEDMIWERVFALDEVKDMNVPDYIISTIKSLVETSTKSEDRRDDTDDDDSEDKTTKSKNRKLK